MKTVGESNNEYGKAGVTLVNQTMNMIKLVSRW
jgi:hypothetical protein